MTDTIAIWGRIGRRRCCARPRGGASAQANPVALESATLQGDEVIETPDRRHRAPPTTISTTTRRSACFDEMDYPAGGSGLHLEHAARQHHAGATTKRAAYGVEKETDFVVFES